MLTSAPPLILLYNEFFPGCGDPIKVDCGGACEFTSDQTRLAQATAVLFHIPTLRGIPLPPKYPGQSWVAWSLESVVNYPELGDPIFMRQFEITMTYRRDATVWWPYFGPDTAAALLKPPRPKTESSPVVYFRSSSVDRCGRTAYAAALMRRVKVDSYGGVLHNHDLPEPDRGWETLLAVTARYKFALVLENSIAEDYVSEKFFYALMSGSVPVYRGAPNIAAFAPGGRCFINAADFAGPAELAAYLNWLNEHDEAYQEYLAWKDKGLSPSVQTLVEAVREPALYRLCEHLRRTAQLHLI
jgi:alpha-1,3-fucosyltransferase 10